MNTGSFHQINFSDKEINLWEWNKGKGLFYSRDWGKPIKNVALTDALRYF